MKHKLAKTTRLAVITAAVTLVLNTRAGEIGHFGGGVMNIRDYVMPDPGVYTAIYNYFYTTGQLNDSHGDEINRLRSNPALGLASNGASTWTLTCTPWHRRLSGSRTLSRSE